MKNKKEEKKGENIFVGFMFLGMGLGYFLDNFLVGMFIGMGLGFIAKAFIIKNN
jgi:F0F1-type ATP synthase assembly protein I